ncbi:MAG: mechanosensitive ion channel family protein [Candidatus Pacebacteria bacterium]|nr:mechanosensitive ion channel family protein [Candidatus Paceibacterota bacterium]
MITEFFKKIIGDYSFWNLSILQNTLGDYVVFLLLFFFFFGVLRLFRKLILDNVKKKINGTSKDIIETIKPPFFWYLSFFLSSNTLTLPQFIESGIGAILIIWITYQVILIIQILADSLLERLSSKESDPGTKTAIKTIGKIVKALVWLFAGLFVLSNLGVNVTSVMAGVGIGGVAIAFALQNILTDLFSSFAIFFDKPFVVGDFIVVGGQAGIVERIGIKTTRIRALQGEEIVISNKELTSERIQNFKKLTKRRIVFDFGIVYGTSNEKLTKIPEIVKGIIEEEKVAELDRVHFAKFGDSALEFEVVYYVLSAQYIDYMDTNQRILLKIKEVFEKEKIEMAFPTQTLFIKK